MRVTLCCDQCASDLGGSLSESTPLSGHKSRHCKAALGK